MEIYSFFATAATEDGVAVVSLAPCSVTTEIGGIRVKVTTESLYPFRDRAKISVQCEKPVFFKLYIRIPGFYDGATVNGEKTETGRYWTQEKEFENETLEVELFARPNFVERGALYAVTRGALTYTLPVKEKWVKREYERKGVERKFPYCDYELYPESEWQYGFSSRSLSYAEKEGYKSAFSTASPLCVVKAKVKPIEWGMREGYRYVPADVPESLTPVGEETEVELVPYACAKLRMTELPLLDGEKR